MGDSALRASSSAHPASTRGSAPTTSIGLEGTPAPRMGHTTPEYVRRPSAKNLVHGESIRSRGGESTRISALETRVVDLSSQVTRNIAMVEQVLDTQRDFKVILMRLLSASTCSNLVPASNPVVVDDQSLPPSTETAPAPSIPEDPVIAVPTVEEDRLPSWMSAETVVLTPNTHNRLSLMFRLRGNFLMAPKRRVFAW
ncbi:hypothetical protein M758_UG159000 [Ceratodon purpureus]|nr:hypothetical protein M758_UG159000 [Ceratodon purpureus]